MHTQVESHADTSIIIIEDNQLLGNENQTILDLMQKIIEQGKKNISIDLSNVKFISSWAIEGFLHACKNCKDQNINFNIMNANERIKSVFSTLKLTKVLNIL